MSIRAALIISLFTLVSGAVGCEMSSSYVGSPTPSATPITASTPLSPSTASLSEMPVTLPLIDAFFFNDERFAADLKSALQLTDDQVTQLRRIAREETVKLHTGRQADTSDQDYQGSTKVAAESAKQRIAEVVGEDKERRLTMFVLNRWREGSVADASSVPPLASPSAPPLTTSSPGGTPMAALPAVTPLASPGVTPAAASSPMPSPMKAPATVATAPYLAPSDTRIVVNAPAYRLDVFENGQLIKSYKVGIGYPEFPLPTGMRRVQSIIFNPTWTPPDEPWVESSGQVKVGEKVEAGSKLNPLGVIKIPIGLPSLIHGGKTPAKLGGFASHGCVGLTNGQVQDLAKLLARLSGSELTDEEIAQREKNRTETKSVKLNAPVPVELRYETMVVEDGRLHIYRDVYERGTNNEETLRSVLESYGVSINQLAANERAEIDQAIKLMSRDPGGKPIVNPSPADASKKQSNVENRRVTRTVKGTKDVVVEVAALAGKGYPAPVELNTGVPKPAPKPATQRKKKR
jgi:lipoprotein-anchoring transpeptidase ErfK/SrfK